MPQERAAQQAAAHAQAMRLLQEEALRRVEQAREATAEARGDADRLCVQHAADVRAMEARSYYSLLPLCCTPGGWSPARRRADQSCDFCKRGLGFTWMARRKVRPGRHKVSDV